MINPYPCIIWPLVILAAFIAYRMGKNRGNVKYSWLIPVVFFVGALLVLGLVVWQRFDEFWMDGLFSIYIAQ